MKKKITSIDEQVKVPQGELMTRKEAIKKSGYMALSAATMMLLFNNTANAQASPGRAPVTPNDKSTQKSDGIWSDQ